MGGGEYGLYYLVKNLDRGKYDPVVVVNGDGPLVEKFRELGVQIVTVPFEVVMLKEVFTRSFAQNLAAAKNLRDALQSLRPDIVQCSDVLTLLLLGPSFLTLRFRLVYSIIFFYEWPRAILFNLLAAVMADKIVFLSKILRDDLRRKTIGIAGKFETIYWGVDTARYTRVDQVQKMEIRSRLGLPSTKKIVGFVGRYDLWKGHIVFLRAAEKLLAVRNDLLFLMVGGSTTGKFFPAVEAYRKNVEREAEGLERRGALILWDHRDDVPQIMRALDVFVCPSDTEPFGLVVCEALSAGVPVVAGDRVGALEIVGNFRGVHTARARDSADFSDKIAACLGGGPDAREEFRPERFPWSATSRDYQALYSRVIR